MSKAKPKAKQSKLYQEMKRTGDMMYAAVMKQREQIITAFIAQYGCKPDEIVQCQTVHGGLKWFLRKMTPEEIAFRDEVSRRAALHYSGAP